MTFLGEPLGNLGESTARNRPCGKWPGKIKFLFRVFCFSRKWPVGTSISLESGIVSEFQEAKTLESGIVFELQEAKTPESGIVSEFGEPKSLKRGIVFELQEAKTLESDIVSGPQIAGSGEYPTTTTSNTQLSPSPHPNAPRKKTRREAEILT